MIDILQQFADHADKMTTGITSLYQPEKEILVEPKILKKYRELKLPYKYIWFEGSSTF